MGARCSLVVNGRSVRVSTGDTPLEAALAEGMIAPLQAQSGNETVVRVFTIAYGENANDVTLQRFADVSGGKAFEGGPDEIQALYKSIASFF